MDTINEFLAGLAQVNASSVLFSDDSEVFVR